VSTVLVTGTDTGVGKTYVACGLARAAVAAGWRVAVRKPAETGCDRDPAGALVPGDAVALRAAAGASEPLDAVCSIRLAEPLAPAVAAARAGVAIDVPRLIDEVRRREGEVDLLLVEGAGGLLVPLAGRTTFLDLARELGARLVVVVGARLGAINHTLLTLRAAEAAGVPVAGWVVNHVSGANDLATRTLAATLRELTDAPLLAEVGFGADAANALAPALPGLLRL
jgi:dethiobiotin synthetase